MKTRYLSILLMSSFLLGACQNGEKENSSINSQPSSQPSSSQPSSSPSSSQEERTINTYIDWDFDELSLGDAVPLAYYNSYEGSDFVVSCIDDDGNAWVQARDINDGARWALMSAFPKDKMGRNIQLQDFEISFTTRLPMNQTGFVSDGGITLCNTGVTGRYDLAFNYNPYELGKGSALNLWFSISTENGPYATTQNNETWGNRGSAVTNFELYPSIEYDVSVCCKYGGEVSFGEEVMTIYIFVNNQLVVAKDNIPYMVGEFGLRGSTSGFEYGNFQVKDFPLVCPDGIDHYSEDEFVAPTQKTFETLPTPSASIEKYTLSWNQIEGASYYDIYTNNTLLTRVEQTTLNLMDVLSDKGTLSLVAVSNEFGVNSSLPAVLEYSLPVRLDSPILTYLYSEQKLTWTSVNHASGYQLFEKNNKIADLSADTLEYDVSTYQEGEFTVVAIGNDDQYLNSFPSNVATLTGPLAAPTLSYDGTNLTWNLIERATGYVIYKNGEEFARVNADVNQYPISEAGIYTIVALGNNTNCTDSVQSVPYKLREIKEYYKKDYKDFQLGKVVSIYSEWKDWSEWVVKDVEDDGTTWIGTSRPDLDWSAVWFPVLDSSNQYLNNYEFAADVLFRNVEGNNNIMQMCFGTKGSNGRFAVEICAGGQYSTIGLYTNVCHEFVTNFNIDFDVAHRIYINYSKQDNGKARVSCLIDNQLVFDLSGLVAAIGDFGLASIRKSDVYFTNVSVRDVPNVSSDGHCYF